VVLSKAESNLIFRKAVMLIVVEATWIFSDFLISSNIFRLNSSCETLLLFTSVTYLTPNDIQLSVKEPQQTYHHKVNSSQHMGYFVGYEAKQQRMTGKFSVCVFWNRIAVLN
jgi:hypothetical protein